MNRRVTKTNYDMFHDRVVITVYSVACDRTDSRASFALFELLNFVASHPEAISFGSDLFDTGAIKHNGIAWVFEVQLIVPK